MSQKALPALPQDPWSSNSGTPSTIKFSNVVEGSLEDFTQRLDILRMRYDYLQTSRRQCEANAQKACNDENHKQFWDSLPLYGALIEKCKDAIKSMENVQTLLVARRVAGLPDVALYEGEPHYITVDEMACREAEVNLYKSTEIWQRLDDLWESHRLEDEARKLERHRAWRHKLSSWLKSLV